MYLAFLAVHHTVFCNLKYSLLYSCISILTLLPLTHPTLPLPTSTILSIPPFLHAAKNGSTVSSQASSCCLNCQPINNSSHVCLKGDLNLDGGGCQNNTFCVKNNPNCPEPTLEADGKVCNNGSNVCQSGACTGDTEKDLDVFTPCISDISCDIPLFSH